MATARKLPVFPGDERSNVYCPNHRSHPWRFRPGADHVDYHDPGWRAVRFIEGFCRHTKGRWKGKRFILFPFQLAQVLTIFGTVDDEGLRVIRTVYDEWARKSGKSELAAAFTLQGLFADGEEGGEVYGAAYDQEQAGLVYNVAADMVELSPQLLKRAQVVRSRKRIVVPKTGSFYWAIPADAAGAHGFNASRVVFDEIHTQKTRELYDVLTTSSGTRAQPLTFGITTAGYDKTTLCWQLHDYSEKVAKGVLADPTWHSDIRNTPDDVDWRRRRYWSIANPGLGTRRQIAEGKAFRSIDELAAKVREAEAVPPLQNTVIRLYLNRWTSQRTRQLPIELWDASAGMVRREDLIGLAAYGGLDLASTTDLAAFVLWFPDEDEPEVGDVLCRFFTPADDLTDRASRDGVPYETWVREGWIEATPGNVIDYSTIRTRIDQDAQDFDLVDVGFDRWGATQLSTELSEAGLEVVGIAQTFAGLGPATIELLRRVKARKVRHGGNPVLRWMVDNVEFDQDPAGLLKPNKKASNGRIDGFVALVMALDRALRQEDLGESVYEERGLDSV